MTQGPEAAGTTRALAGQVALVFGASSGMGLATSRALARAGAAVGAAARREPQLRRLASDIEGAGGRALALPADVSDRAQVNAAVSAVVERWGRLDILINAAAINIPGRTMAELTRADWDRLIAINLTGAFNTIQSSLCHMRPRRRGLIVQISSTSGRWGDWSGPAYQASKHGIVGLCYATMMEERANGIRTTVLLPGCCDTPIHQSKAVPRSRKILDQAMQPEDIAGMCVFLATLPPRTYVPELIMLPGALQCIGHTVVDDNV